MKKNNGFQLISIEFDRKQKKPILSLLILFTNQSNIQRLNKFVIIPMILQKPTLIFTQLKIKTNMLLVVMNVTIAEKFFRTRKTKKAYGKLFRSAWSNL